MYIMKNRAPSIKLLIFFILAFAGIVTAQQSGMWVTAYYAGWQQGQDDEGYLPTKNVDFSAITQVIHFSLEPKSNGTLDSTSNSILPINSSNLISRAHAAGVKVIISIGGWGTDTGFRGATNSSNLSKFVTNLVRFMTTRGYDGIDIDWEVLESSDRTQYTNFITALRTELDKISPRPLLTAATGWEPSIFASLADKFDEINIMTYDMSGAWSGWVTWHNAPIYDGGVRFPSTGELVPSCDGMISDYTKAGVPISKLGIGIDFYGYIWSGGNGTPTGGATAPGQSWTSDPNVTANVPYYEIMDNYYQASYYRFDSGAQASYLSIDNSGSANDKFISYDDEVTCASKVNYVKNNGLGGLIIWELGGGYRSNAPAGQKDVLLQAIKTAVNGGVIVVDTTPPEISFTSPSDNATVSGDVALTATASDNVGVTTVAFKVDGVQVGNQLLSSPYTTTWNSTSVSNGTHSITATASDAVGNTTTATVNVTVSNAPDTTPPAVSITSPANNATVSGNVTLTATATDNVGVASVVFNVDGVQVGNPRTSAPYTRTWNSTTASNGTHNVSATATDAEGNTSTATVTVTVSNSTTDSTPPVVSITSPTNNATVSGVVTLTATASDNSGISNVVFKLDGNQVGNQLTSSPYSTTWNSASVSDGSHSLTVTASDAAGNSTTASININVSNSSASADTTRPEVSITAPTDGASVSGNVTLRANATDNVGVASLVFKVDGQQVGDPRTAPPYTRVWNTTTAANGEHNITATVTDAAGNTSIAAVSVTVANISGDSTPPVVTITSPANNSTVSGTVTLSATATDQVGVVSVVFDVDGIQIGTQVNSAPYSVSWNTSTVTNGTHTISVVASDAADNSSTATIKLTVSNVLNPPSGTANVLVYQDELNPDWFNSSWNVNMNFNATEHIYSGNSSLKVIQQAWGGLRFISGSWSSLVELDPQHLKTLEFAIYGESSNMNINIYLENKSKGSFPTISYGTIPSGKWTLVSVPISTLDPNNLPIGRVIIQDVSGKSVTYDIDNIVLTSDAIIDAVKPSVAFDSPGNSSSISGTIKLTVSASDNVGVTGVVFKVDGNQIGDEVTSGPYSVFWNSTTVADGVHTLSATARDEAGNESTSNISVTVANTSQVVDVTKPTIVFESPSSNNDKVSGTINITVNASDNVGVVGVIFKVDDSQIENELTSVPYTISWNTTSVMDGIHTLSATARDAAGNNSSVSINISIVNSPSVGDNSKPVVSFNNPTNFTKITGTVNLMANATDNVGVVGVTFKVDEIQIGEEVTAPPFSLQWDSRTVANGLHTLSVSARDGAENSSSVSIIITVYNEVTDIGLGDIPSKFSLKQNFPNPFNPSTTIEFDLPTSSYVTLDIYDILGEKVASLINENMGAGSFAVHWNAENLPSGIYIYRLRAGDKLIDSKKMNLLK